MRIPFHRRIFSALLALGIISTVSAVAPKHGWLKTEKNLLLNEKGNIVQLKGLSFYWSTPGWIGIGNYNAGTVNALATDWKCTVVRAAYDRNNGNDNGWNEVKTVIDAAIAKGIYVILDWHSHTAHEQASTAISFFTQKAQEYKNTPNVIFEVYNEPIVAGGGDQKDGSVENGRKTWAVIKTYLNDVTKAIRNTGAKNLIILGTPYYCQHVGVAASDPVEKSPGVPYENVAYAFHFYAASHGPEAMYVERDKTGGMEATYLDAGVNTIPVFVTEWGTTHSDGAQGIDEENTNWWFEKYINKFHLSHCNWSASSGESSSAFSGGTNPSASGTIVKRLLNTSVDEFEPVSKTGFGGPAGDTVHNVPSNYFAAARFNKFYGTHAESSTVAYGYRDKIDRRIPGTVGYLALKVTPATDANWVSYDLKSTAASSKIALRYNTKDGKGNIDFIVDDAKVTQLSLSADTTWKTTQIPLSLTSGTHTLKLDFTGTTGTSYLIEWIEIGNGTIVAAHHNSFARSNTQALAIDYGQSVLLPPGHAYTGYSVIGANGRVALQGVLDKTSATVDLKNLSTGMWVLKFDRPGASDLLKAAIR